MIRGLKSLYPKSSVDVLCYNNFSEVFHNNPYVKNVHSAIKSSNNSALISKLESETYDMIIDLQNNSVSKKIARSVAKTVLSFKKPTLKKFMLVNFKLNLLNPIVSIPELYAKSIDGLKLDQKGPELFSIDNLDNHFPFSNKNIGFCPGAKHFSKMWPKDFYATLGNKLVNFGFKIFLFGGKDDFEICNELSGKIEGSLNLCSDNQLLKTAKLMQSCKLIICNDSGLMHTATAVNVPVAVFFGSTVKNFGFSPYNSKHLIIEDPKVKCRPCSHFGKNNCPKKHFRCMMNLSPDYAFDQILNFYNTL